ncbi:hypothetical protein M758_UG248400 [Ceratodon purpureus]|nr:hypothetical protein M758_UG248400 [Ceratodon purpureus]
MSKSPKDNSKKKMNSAEVMEYKNTAGTSKRAKRGLSPKHKGEIYHGCVGESSRRMQQQRHMSELESRSLETCKESSNPVEEEDKSSKDSVVSPGENDFDKTLREYDLHLQAVDRSPEMWNMHLSFDEFLCQQPIDEEEFGPEEDIWSIRHDCLDLPYPKKEIERE